MRMTYIGPRRLPIVGFLVGALLTSPVASLAGEHHAAPVDRRPSIDVSKIRIDNFGQVDPHYYRGSQPKGSDYADLAAIGVKTLINLTSDDADAPKGNGQERRVGVSCRFR